MRVNYREDKTTDKVRLFVFAAFGFAAFALALLPLFLDYTYNHQFIVSLLISLTFSVSLTGYILSLFIPKKSFAIANYEFLFYTVSVALIIHYISFLNGPLIFIYGLIILAAAYFMNARNLTYLSGLASILVITEYFLATSNGEVVFSITGLTFVLLRVLYLALLALAGKNLGLDLNMQKKEYAKINQLNKELSEIDRVKSEFIDVASHQLKTPLTVIKGNASMALEGDYGEVTDELVIPLKEIDIGAQRLTDIINNVVDTLKYEEDLPLTLNKEHMDLKKIITYEMYSFVSDSWAKNIKIDLQDKAPSSLFTMIDPEKIKLALSIYLENAIKRSLHGEKVEVLVHESRGKAVIEVSDLGPQITESSQSKIFKRFSPEHKEKANLNLNLYVVKRIIDSHKGKAYYKSGEKGSNIFGFELPIERIAKKNRKRIKV